MHISIKRIGKNKRPYAYLQHSYRVPGRKKPKTKSKYLGPAATLNLGGHLAAKLLTDPKAREEFFKSFSEMLAEKDARDAFRAAAENAPVVISGLTVGREWTQEMFDREAMSQKDGAVSAVMQSFSETSQFSDQSAPAPESSDQEG